MNIEILMWIPWYVFLAFILVLFHRLTGCFTQINIFTIVLAKFLINHGLFVPFNFYINDQVNDFALPDITKVRWLVSLVLMYVFFIVGLLIAKTKKLSRIERDAEIQSKKIEPWNETIITARPIFGIIVIALCVFTLVSLWQPALIIQTLSGDLTAADYKAGRLNYGEQFDSQKNIFARIALTIKLSLLPMFTYVYFLLRKQSRILNVTFVFVLAVTVLLGLMSGQKSGLSYTILGLTVANVLGGTKSPNKNRSLRIILIVALTLFFVILPAQYSVQYPGITYLDALQIIQYRVSGETTRTLQLYFYVYPDIFPHLLGLSSSLVSGILGLSEVFDPSRVVRSYIAYGTTTDATGSWNAAFIGAAWADFGYIGVAIQSILLTMLLSYYHKWYITNKNNPIIMGTYISLAFSATNTSEGNLFTVLFTGGLGLTFLFIRFFRGIIYRTILPEQQKVS
jgi:hypothetical protein